MKKPRPEPKVFTEYGKVIQCPCGAVKFRPLSFTLRKIAGIERKCLSLQCAFCSAISTVTKVNDGKPLEQLITLDKENVQNENTKIQTKASSRRQTNPSGKLRVRSQRSKKALV